MRHPHADLNREGVGEPSSSASRTRSFVGCKPLPARAADVSAPCVLFSQRLITLIANRHMARGVRSDVGCQGDLACPVKVSGRKDLLGRQGIHDHTLGSMYGDQCPSRAESPVSSCAVLPAVQCISMGKLHKGWLRSYYPARVATLRVMERGQRRSFLCDMRLPRWGGLVGRTRSGSLPPALLFRWATLSASSLFCNSSR